MTGVTQAGGGRVPAAVPRPGPGPAAPARARGAACGPRDGPAVTGTQASVTVTVTGRRLNFKLTRKLSIWNRDRLYEIMDFGTYMYVLVCTEYIPVRNAENGTYMYVLTSGTPRKFFHGIYLVYIRYIHFPWICQRYTWYIPIIFFPGKILLSSI